MALNHPTDNAYYLDDGVTTYEAEGTTEKAIFSPANKSANITLSNGNHTATKGAGGICMARSNEPITGEAYYEFTIEALTIPTNATSGIGLMSSAATNYDTYLTNADTAGFYAPGGTYATTTGFGINNAQQEVTALADIPWEVGTVIGMAVSMSAKTVKITLDGTTWSPAFDITALGTTIYPAVGFYVAGDSIKINGGLLPFEYVPPAGYSGPDVGSTLTTAYGHVGGSPYIFDFTASHWHGFAAFEPSILDLSSGDEVYNLIIEGNTAADFSGTSHDLASWNLRALNPQDIIIVDNEYVDTIYRYGRLKLVFSGTTPSIKLVAFLKPLADAPVYSLAEQLTVNVETLSKITQVNKYIRDWSTGLAGGGIYSNGTYPLVDGIGDAIYVKSPQQILADAAAASPFGFGAIGDGASHPASGYYDTLEDLQEVYSFATSLEQEMDFLAVQKALYHGGGLDSSYTNFVMCNSNAASQTPLIAIAGTFDIMVHGSKWSFPGMFKQTDDTQYMPNYDFADTSAWVNASVYVSTDILMTTFTGGHATMTDTGNPGTGQKTFYQWGQELTIAPGRYTLRAVASATLGDSYGLGNNNPGYMDISFSALSPGEGGNPIGRSAQTRFNLTPDHTSDSRTLTLDFQVLEEVTVWPTFSGGGYANIVCTEFSITKWLPNCAILCTRDGSPDHYPIPRGFDGLELIGPGGGVDVTAVKYKSFSNMDGNLIRFSNCAVHDWGKAFSFSDGAYLTEFQNVHVYSCSTALFSEIGSFNAGENLRFIGGGIYNNSIGIDNPAGMEFTLYGTAFDFCAQMVTNNSGRIDLIGVHLETNVPTDASKPLFHITTGQVAMHGGMFLGAGGVYSAACAPIKTEYSTAVFEVFGTELYNLSSDPAGAGAGAIMEGPGQFIVHGWRNSGNPNIGPLVISYAPVMDALSGAGRFPEPNVYTPDPTGILLEGGAWNDALPITNVTASIAGSIMSVTATDATIYEGMRVRGAGIKDGTLLSFIPTTGGTGGTGDYLINIPQYITSQSMVLDFDGVRTRWSNVNGTLEWSGSYSYGDSGVLKFTKLADGLNSAIRFLIPIEPNGNVIGYMRFLSPVDYSPVDPDETVPLYYRLFYVQKTGEDEYGRPIIRTIRGLENETDLNLPRAGSADWQLRSLLTTYSNPSATTSDGASAHAPAGATHLGVFLDTQSLPNGHVFYIADMRVNVTG